MPLKMPERIIPPCSSPPGVFERNARIDKNRKAIALILKDSPSELHFSNMAFAKKQLKGLKSALALPRRGRTDLS